MLLEMGRLSRCNQNADWHRAYTGRRRVGCGIDHREGVGEPTTHAPELSPGPEEAEQTKAGEKFSSMELLKGFDFRRWSQALGVTLFIYAGLPGLGIAVG